MDEPITYEEAEALASYKGGRLPNIDEAKELMLDNKPLYDKSDQWAPLKDTSFDNNGGFI